MNKIQLKNYINLRKEVKQIEERLKEYEFKKCSAKSQVITGMPCSHGSGNNTAESVVLSFVDLEKVYVQKLAKLNNEIFKIEKAITSLENSVERQLIRARYIDGKTWEEVCALIGYSWSQTHRIHARALKKLQDLKDDIE